MDENQPDERSTIFEVAGHKLDAKIRWDDKLRLEKYCEVDLADALSGELFRELAKDGLAVDFVWTIVSEQWLSLTVKEHDPDREFDPLGTEDDTVNAARKAFHRGLGPEEVDALRDAMIAAIVGFSHPKTRKAIWAMIEKSESVLEAEAAEVIAKLNRGDMDDEIKARMDAIKQPTLTKAKRRSTSTSSATN